MPHTAVVFVSYLKVPGSRLQEHFQWNDHIYRQFGDRLRVYVVSDIERELPDYAETVVVPFEQLPTLDGVPVFSLSMTKNAGIAKAIKDGADVIICTDVDIAFERASFDALMSVDINEPQGVAIMPIYRMAESFEKRVFGRLDVGCMGTISMTAANWKRVSYDEKYIAYGGEDGRLFHAIQDVNVRVLRTCEVSHIAHVPGDGDRTPGSGSATCWGRADGFNPDNFAYNRRLLRTGSKPRRRRAGRRNEQ